MCQKNRSALSFADSAPCESLAKSSTLSQTGFWQPSVAAEPPVFRFRRIWWGLMALCGAMLFATPTVRAEDWMFKVVLFPPAARRNTSRSLAAEKPFGVPHGLLSGTTLTEFPQ